ncbi:MAG: hypothetical protein ABI885_17100, partial [Gammaproteobacteria bacterium]
MSLSALIFVGAFIAACVLAFKRHPVFGLVAYIGTFYLSPQMRWWGQGALYPIRWALLSAAITLIAVYWSKKVQRPVVPLLSQGMMWLYLMFVVWMMVQTAWALDGREHADLLGYYLKFCLSIVLVYYCVDSPFALRLVLWSVVGGCFYFGWIAFTTYLGGRFEGFGGAGIGEANAGALALAIGVLAASSLWLEGSFKEKCVLFVAIPFMLNGIVTTISRSGLLSLAAGALVFIFFSPRQHRKQIRVPSVLAVTLFLIVAGPSYWNR